MKVKLSMYIEKYCNLAKPAKAAIAFTFCNILLKGINFISVPLYAYFLPPDEYGLLSLYIATENIILIMACWDVSYGAYQKGLFRYSDDVVYFENAIQLFTTFTTTFFFLLIIIGYPIVGNLVIIPRKILWIFMIYALFQTANRNWMVKQQNNYAYKKVVAVTLLNGILMALVPLAAILLYQPKADVKFTAQLLASIVVFAVFYLHNCHYFRVLSNFEKFKEQVKFIIKFQLPCVFHSLSLVVLSQADRIMIGNIVGTTQAAYYSVAYSLSVILTIIFSSLDQVLYPWTYQMMEQKNYRNIRNITNHLVFCVCAMVSIYTLIAPEVIIFLFPHEYQEAIICIPPIAGSVFFIFLYGRFTCIESYFEKTKYLMYVSIMCGLINIILNYIFIGIFGYVACAYTTLFSYILFAVGHYWIMRKICVKRSVTNLFSAPLLLGISLVVLCQVLIMQVLYYYTKLRYILIFAICLLVIAYRKKLFAIVKTVMNKN